jgi:nucleoside-diphosphate-sugar epimerase
VGRFVLLSSRAVYGRRLPGAALDEDHPAWPETHYGAMKAALEAFVSSFAAGGDSGWGICALRPTGVYGLTHPVGRSKWLELVAAIADGRPWADPRGGTEVHGADLARAVWLLLTAPAVAGGVFNCSDLYVTSREVALIVQRLTGARGPLPDPPAALPTHVMAAGRLRGLGWRPGGQGRLERTVGELVEAARRGPLRAPCPG